MPTESRRIEFPNDDGEPLAGRLELPESDPVACALFAHCFTCSKDVAAASRISRALAARGLAVLRFDFTGLGNSDGDFENTNFSSNVEDLVSAAAFLREHHGPPQLMVGHSLGGAAVLAAAEHVPECRAVATLGSPANPQHVKGLLHAALPEIHERGIADVELAGRTFTIRRQFLDDLEDQSQHDRIRGLRRALLVMHSPADELVPLEEARGIYEAARHPKSFVSLDGADHLLTRREDSEWVADILAAWAPRYVGGGATLRND